jgi:hypothetical protein
MRPVEFGEALAAGTRLTLFSQDKPDHFFTVIKFWMDETSGVALAQRERDRYPLFPGLLKHQIAEERLASIANEQEICCQRMRNRHAKLSRLGFGSRFA